MTTTTDRAKIVERLQYARYHGIFDAVDNSMYADPESVLDLIEQDGQRIAALEAELKALRFDFNVATTEAYNEGYAAARAALDFTAPDG